MLSTFYDLFGGVVIRNSVFNYMFGPLWAIYRWNRGHRGPDM
jgi:hypothetical protein